MLGRVLVLDDHYVSPKLTEIPQLLNITPAKHVAIGPDCSPFISAHPGDTEALVDEGVAGVSLFARYGRKRDLGLGPSEYAVAEDAVSNRFFGIKPNEDPDFLRHALRLDSAR